MTANIDHLFNKAYYRAFSDEDWRQLSSESEPNLSDAAKTNIKRINEAIKCSNINDYSFWTQSLTTRTPCYKSFDLETTYPGLLTGVGELHSAGKIENEFKLGFHFDHSTGLPVIPGSTVKGALRSIIDETDYLQCILNELQINVTDIGLLEKEIFLGERSNDLVSIYKRDIFLDAFIVKSACQGGRFLDDDFITPHHDNQFKNPTPIQFLKVMPGVRFRFQFDVKDGLISADEKCKLFKRILQDIGIGAKTNVGYGHLVEPTWTPEERQQQQRQYEIAQKEATQRHFENLSPADRILERYKYDLNVIMGALTREEISFDNDIIETKKSLALRLRELITQIIIHKDVSQKQKKKHKLRQAEWLAVIAEKLS